MSLNIATQDHEVHNVHVCEFSKLQLFSKTLISSYKYPPYMTFKSSFKEWKTKEKFSINASLDRVTKQWPIGMPSYVIQQIDVSPIETKEKSPRCSLPQYIQKWSLILRRLIHSAHFEVALVISISTHHIELCCTELN